MRYTFYRGLAQVSNWVRLKYAAMNLKILARWKARSFFSLSFPGFFHLHTPFISCGLSAPFLDRPLFDRLKARSIRALIYSI